MNYDTAYRLYEEGCDAFYLQDYQTAIRCFEQALSHAVHYKTMEKLGECHVACGDVTQAIIHLAGAVALNRGAKPRRLLAQAFLSGGYYAQAIEFADQALEIAPGYRSAMQIKQQAESAIYENNS